MYLFMYECDTNERDRVCVSVSVRFKSTICWNCIHHYRHLSIFMQCSEWVFSYFFRSYSFLSIFFIDSWLHFTIACYCTSYSHDFNSTSVHRTRFNFAKCLCTRCHIQVQCVVLCCVVVHWMMSDANKTLVKCRVCDSEWATWFFSLFPFEVCPSFCSFYLFIVYFIRLNFYRQMLYTCFTVSSTTTTHTQTHTNLFDLRLWYIWIPWWWFVNIWTFQPILRVCLSVSGFSFECIVSEWVLLLQMYWISTHFVPQPKSRIQNTYIYKRLHLYPWINWTVAGTQLNFEIEIEIEWGKSHMNSNLKWKLSVSMRLIYLIGIHTYLNQFIQLISRYHYGEPEKSGFAAAAPIRI